MRRAKMVLIKTALAEIANLIHAFPEAAACLFQAASVVADATMRAIVEDEERGKDRGLPS